MVFIVEGLYCKRPIQFLAFSKMLTTPPPSLPGECVYPPAFGAGGGHTRWAERGWGVNSLEDARHCSVLYICKYFLVFMVGKRNLKIRDLFTGKFENPSL
jgi:hypothetical protein